MNRRRFLTFAALASAARQAPAQRGSGKPYRVGFLSMWGAADGAKHRSTDGARYRKLFQDRLAERGFTPENLEVRYFSADGRIDLLPARAREVAAWAPNAVFAPGFLEAKAMQTETRTIPIVFCGVSDPVEIGLVRELGQPGGNVTGAAQEYAGLTVKRLELVRELLPRATRVALLMRSSSESPYSQALRTRLLGVATGLGLRLENADVAIDERGLSATLASLAPKLPDMVLPYGYFFVDHDAVARDPLGIQRDFERRYRVPVFHSDTRAVVEGCVIGLGIDTKDDLRRGVDILARILRGARPANTPVEMAARYELAVNLGAARAIGLAIPQAIMIRADRVLT